MLQLFNVFSILFHKWKQTPLLKIVFYYKINAILNQVAKAQGLPTTFPPKTRWKHFLGYPECFRSLEIHSKRSYKKFYLFGHPRGTWGFSKLPGPISVLFFRNFYVQFNVLRTWEF